MARLLTHGIVSGCLLLFPSARSHAQGTGTTDRVALTRNYQAGETLKYEMKGSNSGWEYRIQAGSLVKKDAAGGFYEEIGWSDLQSNAPTTLSPASLAFRQTLSLGSEGKYLTVPDLSKVQPFLIGPITDLLTFYSDLFLAKRLNLATVGQHTYFEHGTPSSWSDGQHVIVGQDSIDFDLTLVSANTADHTAVITVRHVPPKHSQLHLPATWMEAPVGDTLNNFVNVVRQGDKYEAQVGQEKFNVTMTVDTRYGKIVSAQMNNPVTTVIRECDDAKLTVCTPAKPGTILRQVSLTLIR